ncbi:MAG: STAS domain-containing protein [Pseudomonadota bacterium]|nr:STAS domain-containing protein [Pseudomonadota bacterium]
MEYVIRSENGQIEAQIMGRLSFETKSSCGKLISELAAQEPKEAVIDLRDVGCLDSAGLGFLLRAQNALHRKGAQRTLRVPNDGQTKKMLSMSKFEELIPFVQ